MGTTENVDTSLLIAVAYHFHQGHKTKRAG